MNPTAHPPAPTDRRRPSRRSVDLPAEVRAVLRLIVADLRDVPRDCLRDPGELFVWLRRMAARIEGVERIQIEADPHRSASAQRPQNQPVGGLSAAHGYGGSPPGAKSPPVARKSGLRTIVTRKGKPIPVEIRHFKLWP